ncbi:MAG: AAA family ATPase [Acidimicrobiales bacterium]
MTAPPGESDQLLELVATNLGVIEHLGLVFGRGVTAITGETGAGKTLLITALDLLTGARADSTVVGPHGEEAVVEGRFLFESEELVLRRVVPRDGRSRAYVNGQLATAATLADYGRHLVELHGQNGHTALTSVGAQRAALDLFGGIDVAPLVEARVREREILDQLAGLGGDERERLRELELYRFQVEDVDRVAITSAREDADLRGQEEVLAGATERREKAALAAELLGGDGPAGDALARVMVHLQGSTALDKLATRVRDAAAEVTDIAAEARALAESSEADPAKLAQVQERRRELTDLRRKYGDTLADVLVYRDQTAARLAELENHEALAAALEADLAEARTRGAEASARVGAARRRAAPELAAAVANNVRGLALPNAEIECIVGDDPGDSVQLRISMNAGSPPQPLAKIASGGELARTMLALRLVLSADPATMVFDEVDAGVGGAAAQAVGSALGRLGRQRQVLDVLRRPDRTDKHARCLPGLAQPGE